MKDSSDKRDERGSCEDSCLKNMNDVERIFYKGKGGPKPMPKHDTPLSY
jgi:hypothetical protein